MIRVLLWFAGGFCLINGCMLIVAAAKDRLQIVPDYIRKGVQRFIRPVNYRSTYAIIGIIVLLLGLSLFFL